MAMPYWCAVDEDEGEIGSPRPAPRRLHGELVRRTAASDSLQDDWEPGAAEAMAAACSEHAAQRRAQRHLRFDQLVYVLTYGERVYRTGATFHVLRRCDIDPGDLGCDAIARLEGVVVLVKGNTVVTVYRHRQSFRRICRKQAYGRQRERPWDGQGEDRCAA